MSALLDIDNYTIQHIPLKSSTYGKVFRASSNADGSQSIDKQLHISNSVVPDLRKEISGLVQCRHANVVAYLGYHYSHEEGVLHVLTEYCDEGSLRDLINGHRMSKKFLDEDTLTHYMHQLVRGLDFIHRKGMTHRDLKPENIFIKVEDADMRLKIADFGLATLLDIIDKKRGLLHWIDTVDYMAPEVRAGAEYGRACDIYSLGVITFELANLGLEKYHTTSKFEPLDEELYSKELSDLVRRTLSVEPSRRPECFQILQSEVIEENVRRESQVSRPSKASIDTKEKEKLAKKAKNKEVKVKPNRDKKKLETLVEEKSHVSGEKDKKKKKKKKCTIL